MRLGRRQKDAAAAAPVVVQRTVADRVEIAAQKQQDVEVLAGQSLRPDDRQPVSRGEQAVQFGALIELCMALRLIGSRAKGMATCAPSPS